MKCFGNNIIKGANSWLYLHKLIIEVQRMRNVKAKVIPVLIGATGTTSKPFRPYLSNVLGKYEMKASQKSHIGH